MGDNRLPDRGGAVIERRERVASLVSHNVAAILLEELGVEELKWVNITGCIMRKDLKIAYIYYSVIKGNREEIQKALEREKKRIKKYLAKRIVLKYMPDIVFKPDKSTDLDELFREIKE